MFFCALQPRTHYRVAVAREHTLGRIHEAEALADARGATNRPGFLREALAKGWRLSKENGKPRLNRGRPADLELPPDYGGSVTRFVETGSPSYLREEDAEGTVVGFFFEPGGMRRATLTEVLEHAPKEAGGERTEETDHEPAGVVSAE